MIKWVELFTGYKIKAEENTMWSDCGLLLVKFEMKNHMNTDNSIYPMYYYETRIPTSWGDSEFDASMY